TIPNGSTAAIDVTDASQFPYYQLNQVIGIAASTVGGTNAGYQFYASIYNPTAGAHVGNRIAVGSRFLQTGYRCNVHVTGLPDLSGTDSEWAILIAERVTALWFLTHASIAARTGFMPSQAKHRCLCSI